MDRWRETLEAVAKGEPWWRILAQIVFAGVLIVVGASIGTGFLLLLPGTILAFWWVVAWRKLALEQELGTVTADATRQRCARDSDWCDGRICRERGIACPNADPER